jgi:hypothetical protein
MILSNARGRYEMGDRRRAIAQALGQFESKHPFGHSLAPSLFSNAIVSPDFLLGQGAYGTTFSGVLTRLDERVIMKIAWENKESLDAFHSTSKIHMTTVDGVKAFD